MAIGREMRHRQMLVWLVLQNEYVLMRDCFVPRKDQFILFKENRPDGCWSGDATAADAGWLVLQNEYVPMRDCFVPANDRVQLVTQNEYVLT